VVASPLPGDTGDIEGGWLPVKSYPTDRVRNILIVGHGGAGKTSLVEAVLHSTGATNRIGRVEDGTTVTDFEPEETRKQISVSLAVAPVEYDGFKVNLLDAPGYADFIGDVRSALPAADAVLFVISAVRGGPDRGRLDHGRGAGPAPGLLHQQVGPGPGLVLPLP
jgi:peptide subunit release factor RF-3